MRFPLFPLGVLCEDDPDPAPPSPGSNKPKRIACEFCECSLSGSGEILGKLSGKAREFRGHAETIERQTGEIDTLKRQVADLTAELTAKKKELDKKSSFW